MRRFAGALPPIRAGASLGAPLVGSARLQEEISFGTLNRAEYEYYGPAALNKLKTAVA